LKLRGFQTIHDSARGAFKVIRGSDTNFAGEELMKPDDDELALFVSSNPYEKLMELTSRAVSAKEELATRPVHELTSPRPETYQFGFRIPTLPDFLLDHTLLEKEPHERIAEHCRRWTQFIAGLWREKGVTFALVYQWNPVTKNFSGSRPTNNSVGSIEITLLGSAVKNDVPENIGPAVERALQTFGFSPVELSSKEIEQIISLPDNEVFEVRQRDDRVQVNTEFIRRFYANELSPDKLESLDHGVYTVSPWWGAGGSNLVPFQALVAQERPVSVWVLLRPVSLNEIAYGRAWFMDWTRLLAKWSDDSAAADKAVTINRGVSRNESESKTATIQVTETVSNDNSTGESGDYWLWNSWNTGKREGTASANSNSDAKQTGTSTGTQEGVSVTEGNRTFSSKDPQAKWLADESAAFFRKLTNPFYATVYCFSEDSSAARVVANAIASTVSEETSFEPPPGETSPRRSNAQMVALDRQQRKAALSACRTLTFEPSAVQSSPLLRPGEPQNLNYIVDARAAGTVFRFPVNVRGGIPGIKVKQQAPDFHPGEIHLTVPKGSIALGKLGNFGLAFVEAKAFKKHALITGFTGSGKTVTVLNLLHQFWIDCNIPFLVIESAKQEYRGLLRVEGFDDTDNLRVYTLGNEVCAPFRFNPFELLPGVRVEAHISKLQTCFEGALPPIGPLASLIYEALLKVYDLRGWRLTDQFPRAGEKVRRSFPTMTDFAKQVEELIKVRGYQGEVRDNLTAAIAGRIKPLTLGSKGRMFDTQRSIPSPAELFNIPTILELNDLNQDDKALVVMFLLTLLREYRELDPALRDDLKHVTVVEEAHNVLENVQSAGSAEGASADTRYKAVQAFCNMLAEIRALGEGLIIADQSPEKLAPDAMRNTNVQIAHQLRDSRDREAIAKAMIMDEEQRDFLGKLETGNAALFVTGLEKATFIQIPKYYPTNADRVFKAGESGQDQKARLQREFRGLGFGPVKDEKLKTYMDELTKGHRRLDFPFAGCESCKANGCHRDAMFMLSQHEGLQKRFSQSYELSHPDTRKQRGKKRDDFWSGVVLVANAAAAAADATADLEAAWCFFVHIWDTEQRRQHPGKKTSGLNQKHRNLFERKFNQTK
jgi:hypothetical protein